MQEINVGYRREFCSFFLFFSFFLEEEEEEEEHYRKRAAEKRCDISVMDRKQRGAAFTYSHPCYREGKPSGKPVMKNDIFFHRLNIHPPEYVNI